MKKNLVAVLAAAAVLSAGSDSLAKVDWKPAPKQQKHDTVLVGGAVTIGTDSDFGLGARVEFPLETWVPGLSLAGGFNYFFPNSYDSWWEVNTNLLYGFKVNKTFTPYVGAGLNYGVWKGEEMHYTPGFGAHTVSDNGTSASMNLIGGCKFNLDIGFTPFVEARVGVGENNQLELTAGGLFGF